MKTFPLEMLFGSSFEIRPAGMSRAFILRHRDGKMIAKFERGHPRSGFATCINFCGLCAFFAYNSGSLNWMCNHRPWNVRGFLARHLRLEIGIRRGLNCGPWMAS